MTASRDITARLLEPHTLDIRNIVEVRAILDLVAVERAEAAAEIASLRAMLDASRRCQWLDDVWPSETEKLALRIDRALASIPGEA